MRASSSASTPPSPHAHTSPCASMHGRVNAHDRGLALTRSSSAGDDAWGMSVHLPSPSNLHAWYAQSKVPSSSTRPSESGASLCGHLSSKTFHLSSPSFHTTTSLPSSVVGCGLDVSRRSMTATGYHCFSQLNSPDVSPRFTASTNGTRSGLMPMRGMALDASLAISSAPMVVPPAAVTLHRDLTRVRERDATRHARTADALDAWPLAKVPRRCASAEGPVVTSAAMVSGADEGRVRITKSSL